MTSSSSSAFSRLILPSLVWLSVSLLAIGSASAASADKIYFTASTNSSATTDSLNRIDADGTNQTVLAADTANFVSPDMCAVDSAAGFVWVADGAGSFKLIRYDLNGSLASRNEIYTANTNQIVRGVMVHTASQKLYVITNSATAADDRLIQMNYDGSGAVDLAAGATHFQNPAYGCIDPVRGYVYVADNFGNNTSAGLLRYNLDGTGRTQVKTWTELNPNPGTITAMAIQGVAVDRSTGQIYVVTSSGTATADRVQRVNADFSGLVELMAGSANFNNPVSIHVDRARNRLLVGDLGTTTAVNIFAFDLNGGNRTTFTTVTATAGIGYTAGIALHSLTAPAISDVVNQNVAMNGNTGALAVTVNDAETALSDLLVYGTSSNTTLVPDSNIVTGGSGGSRTVTVTPAAGQTGSATITLYVDDGQRQTTDTFTVNVTAPSNNADLAALTTTASGFAPTFAAGTTAYTANVPNATTSVTVTATRAEANATMQVRVNGGSFTALTSGSPSSALALNVGTNPIDVRVTAQDGITQKTYTLTVTRAAVPPNLSVNDVTLNEGNSGTTTFSFTVSLSAPAPVGGVTFDIATANNTATQPSDYTQTSLTAQTIPAGSSSYTFNVPVVGDTTVEPTENFFVNVTNITNAIAVDSQGTGSITNDDVVVPPTITSVSPARGPIAGGTTVVITGTGFTGVSAVNFGTTPATGFTVNSPTQITATLPAGTGGIFDISVVTGTGTGTGSGLFYYFTTTGGTPAIAASKVDIFTPNGAGKVLPGAPIQYRTLIANTGGGDATTVDFADSIPANTTLVPGSVNVSPLAEDNVYSTIVNTQLAAGTPTVLSGPVITSTVKVTDNDCEFLTDTFIVSAFDATSAAGGSVVMVTSGVNMGSFTYVPAPGFVGADSFTYTLRDDGTDSTAGNADDLTGVGIVVINVVEADTVASGTQKVWYIDNSYAGANGAENGTSARPFNALSDVSAATGPDAVGDTLYLLTGSGGYTGGITLLADQSLIGANESLVLNSVTLAAAGTDPVIANSGGVGVTLATGNTLRGFTIGNTSGGDIAGTAVGTLTVSNVICNGAGPIFTVDTSGALAVTLETATTINSGTTGISLTGCTGSFTATNGAISSVTGDDVLISGGAATVSIGSSITNSAGRSVNVTGKTSGTVTFSGLITDGVGSTGISLTNNTGSTINFTGGLALSTGTNAAFTATGGGTVNVTGSANSITTTTGTALNVANTTIGASGLTFQSITAGTASGTAGVGISLDTTGSLGGLTVTGTGSAGSGGTIQRKTGANLSRTGGIGIYLNNTANVSLTRMQLNDFDNFAIRGFGVSGFTLANCVINGVNGNSTANLGGTDEQGEGAVYFGNAGVTNSDGLNGTVSITNSTIQGGSARNLSIADTASTSVMRATISGCTFGLTQNLLGGNQSLAVEARNSGTTSHVSVTNSIFTGSMSDAMNFTGQTGTTMHVIVGGAGVGNTITNSHPGNNIGGGSMVFASQGIMFFDARNNTMSGANGSAVTIFKANLGTQMEGTFDSNVIGTNGVANSGSATGNGIFLSAAGAGAIKLAITNNMIQRYSGNAGIYADNTDGSYTVDLTVTGNTVRQPGPGVFAGLAVTNGSPSSADTTNVFLRALNNNFADGDPNNVNDIIVGASGSAAGTHTFTLSGATAGDVASEAAIQAFLQTNNNLAGAAAATVVDAYVDAPVTFSAFKASLALPAAPGAPLPLLFAETEPGTPESGILIPESKTASEAKTAVLTSKTAPKPVLAEKALTNENLQKLVLEAKARWIASGLTSEQKAALEALRIEISDLNELHLGQAAGDLIQISRTAAGNAWFIDQTPSDDAEFELRHSSFVIRHSAAGGGVDLLTTLMHEMGHRLGLPDTYALRDRSSIMYGYLTRGERRLPAPNQARGAVLSTEETQRYLGATINIGTLPAGKSVTIVGTVLVNDPANTQLISSQGTVSGGNFASVLTDDPAFAGAANPTTTPVERPDATVVSASIGTTPTNAPTLSWTIVFSTAVSNVTASNFALANTGLTAPSITSVTAIGPQPTDTWSVTASTGTGSGTLGLNMANDAGSLSHDITNQPFTGQVYTIDKIAPVFSSITRQTPSAQNTNADTLVFRATFSETVVGVDAADFTVSGTTATISGITGTGPYDLTLSGGDLASLNGTVSLALAGAQNIADTAGNPLPATAPITNQTYIVDNTVPTVAMTSATGNPAANAVIPVTVQFSETVTGFDLTDITVAGGSKGNFVAVDGDTYTFDLTPTGPGVTVTADVAGSSAQDAAGNNNSAATQFTRSIVDAVSIAATTATAAEGGATGLYTFTRGASAGDLTVSFQLDASSTTTAATDFTLSSSGTLTFTPGTGAGTIVIPNGQLTATVTLTALTESPNPAEAAETARLNVVAGSGYVAGGSPNATVTITENSFLVTTTSDSGTGSLRQAAANADAIAGADTITFSDGTGGTTNFTDATLDTITLSGGQVSLGSDITINGPGADTLQVRNTRTLGATSRVFIVPTGTAKAVVINGLTMMGGNINTGGGCMFIDFGANVTLRIVGCTITGNATTSGAAGLFIPTGNSVTVLNSTISGNTASGAGGAGGIDNSGSLTLINSTISGNAITGSQPSNAGGVLSFGTTFMANCTVTNNNGVGGTGGVRQILGTFTVVNSIIAANQNNSTIPDITGSFTSNGGNIIGNAGTATGFTNGTNSDQVGTGASPVNPQLAALANNGGRTQTHALLAGSPALNAGLNAQIPADTFDINSNTNTTEAIPFDQRGTGFTRAIGTVDIGAFELQKSVSIGNLAAISEGNSGTTNFVFTITRTGDTTGDVNMTYTVSGAAVNGTDFVGGTLPTGTATITSGNSTTTVTIPVSGDTTVEPNEAFTVTLTSPDNGYVVSGAPATSTINNDDAATVSIAKITDGAEANTPTNGKFRVTQTAASSVDTTVAYTVTGTSTSGTDFTALSGSIVIPAGSTTADIDVTILNDGNTVEPTETIILTISSVVSANAVTLGTPDAATMNLTDDDTSVITLAAVSADKNEGTGGASTAFTFSATLSNPVQGGFTIAYTTSDGTALAASDYTDNDSTLTFTGTASESQTITVLVTHDGTNEIDETFTVALGSITGTTLGASLSTAGSPQTGTIRNDDALTVSIAATDADADENTAGTGTYRITRNGVLGSTTVQLAIDASSSAVAADWTQSGATFASRAPGSTGTIVIPAGDTFVDITLTPSADLHAEAAETVRLNITPDAAYTIGSPTNATVTIGQNDFLVINTNDAGEGTLRQAILNANAIPGTDTITFSDGTGGTVNFTDATADTITLASSLTISSSLQIQGIAAPLLILSGNRLICNGGDVLLGGLTITNSTSRGLHVQPGTTSLTLVGVAVVGNSVSSFAAGGGLFQEAGNLTVINCTFSGNSNTGGTNGGGLQLNSSGTKTIINSTISGNTSSNEGGGIRNTNGALTVINCTVTNNSAVNGGSGLSTSSSMTVSNSLIAGNVNNTTRPDVSGNFTSGGGNIIGNVGTVTGFTATNDLTGTGAAPVNPLLGPLQDNGGPTLTHMLLNGSPAINNGLAGNLPADTLDLDGDLNVAEALPVDQRGGVNLRTRGTAPDAGAVEAFAFEPTITASTTDEDTQSTSGLVVGANTADGGLTTHFKITSILNGTLFQNDGTTAIAEGSYITKAQGAAGLKFTPSLNLNTPNTPAGFGFSAQAAISTSAGDERGVAVPVVITVNSVNDLPTVVAPGLPDIRLTIGDVVVIPLGANFADVDLQTLTFTVSGNTVPAKASATITGTTNVTVTGLTFGVTDLTIQADDGTMGLVTDTFQVAVGTVNPTPTMPATPPAGWRVNSQTALFDIDVPVQNTTAFDINGFRLTVDLSAYAVSHPTLRLINYSSPAGVLPAYVDYPYPVAIGETVNVRLSFFVATRVMPNPFNPTLTVTKLTTSAVAGPLPAGTYTQAVIQKNEAGRILLTWPSTPGRWYRIYYSANLTTWTPSATPIQASANQVQWIDSGAPFTQTPPAGSRFYQVTEIPAPAPAPPP